MDGKLISDFFTQKIVIVIGAKQEDLELVGDYNLKLMVYQVPVLVKEALKMIENDETPTLEEICKRLEK